MAEVVLEEVGKTYAGPPPVRAVVGVDLRIAEGEFVVLVGPSGCGKSTLLRMVAGLETVTEGTVRIGDRVVNDVPPRDRDVAMVFQDYALYPHLTVRRNMSLGLELRRTDKAEIAERVGEAAALLDLEPLLDRRPGQLSGGQRQRVAVGRAIVRKPACFLFDEPLSNLDARLRLQLRAELKALHLRLGITSLYVTHDQEEAMTLGSRIVVLDGGQVQQVGTPLEVYREPANRFVAGFVGTPPMNFVEGILVTGPSFTGGGLELSLDPERVAGRTEGSRLTIGIRPEAMREQPGPDSTPLSLEVRVTEPLGDRMDLLLSSEGGASLVARVEASEGYRPGRTATLHVRPTDVHVFESA